MTVTVSDIAVGLARAKERILLAALLLNANRAVPISELTEAVWGIDAPRSAVGTLRDYVKELRKRIAPRQESQIVTVPGGYLIKVDSADLDVLAFQELESQARQAAAEGAWALAADRWLTGEALWRGQPLADVPSELLTSREVPRLTEMRVRALESRLDADLHLGRHAEVIADLRRLTATYPLRERLHALLMLALYRDGQQAAAQSVFHEARTLLVDELGTEPGPELRQLHRQVLASDPALGLPALAPSAATTRARADQQHGLSEVPRQLPAAVSHFTGRTAELAALTGLLTDTAEPAAVVISVLAGTAGVGKTAVAVHWAHRVAPQFPDGQLYMNLRGYDPAEPVEASEALAGFLRALGVPGTDIPDDLEERARLYRSRLAGKRILVLLDNARDGEQIRPLLPGAPDCLAIITSRDVLAGLVATDGAVRLELDLLPLADAVALLRSLIGRRVDDDPDAAADLARLCARLPLAIRIATELASARPATPLARLLAELRESRLDSLDAGEDRADFRAVFSWSLRQLPGEVVAAFALIGLHPGADLDAHAAAALTGLPVRLARRALTRLHRASLLQSAGNGWYGTHDLLRAYAREQAAARHPPGEREQALSRLFDYYLAAAAAAMDAAFPAEKQPRTVARPLAVALPDISGEAGARAWLDRERANLVAVVAHCARNGWPGHAASVASTLFRYLMNGNHLPQARAMYSQALQATRSSGDLPGQAEALNGLGGIGIKKGRSREAAGHYHAALELYRRCGDKPGQARALRNLGATEGQLHRHQSSARYYRQAIAASRLAGDRLGAARTFVDLAAIETELGHCDQAARHLNQAIPVLHRANDRVYEALALERLGALSVREARLTAAAEFFEQARAVYLSIGHQTGAATQLRMLGWVSVRSGDHEQAIAYLHSAIALGDGIGDLYGQIEALDALAIALHETGEDAAARAELRRALRLAAQTGNTYQQARAHHNLADSNHRASQDDQARDHWRQALTLYTQVGASEAEQVRSRLSALAEAGQLARSGVNASQVPDQCGQQSSQAPAGPSSRGRA
jgi:DNA-binding SARP family transcriptional activator/tetratricopeptide (TPR) repeat protein